MLVLLRWREDRVKVEIEAVLILELFKAKLIEVVLYHVAPVCLEVLYSLSEVNESIEN